MTRGKPEITDFFLNIWNAIFLALSIGPLSQWASGNESNEQYLRALQFSVGSFFATLVSSPYKFYRVALQAGYRVLTYSKPVKSKDARS